MEAQYFHYEILKEFNLSELEKHKTHRRLQVFYEKGCVCVECGIEATKLALGRDRGGNLHLDVYTDDFYPLTVDHILPKSKGGSNDIKNLQPMCCLCNWGKGNGDKPARIGNRKYRYSDNIPGSSPKKIFNEDEYTKENIIVGDVAWVKTGKRMNQFKKIGKIMEFCINPHTGRDGVKLENNRISIHHIEKIYKKK